MFLQIGGLWNLFIGIQAAVSIDYLDEDRRKGKFQS